MKTIQRRGNSAFTLIELMAVITIIVILAGLVAFGLAFVNEKQATEKTKLQISLLSKAIEEYKQETGQYPPTANLNPSGALNSGNSYNSDVLFKSLYWDSDNDGIGVPADTDQKIYLPDLDPATTKQGWTSGTASATTKILDPWGMPYLYRSAKSATGVANANTTNPEFDLWSAGKNGSTKPATPADPSNRDDIKN